ncbi:MULTISPECIES: DUF1906 domain-containing protein [Actinoplanes]|uniref:DUF1906 domain-containing protein n=1 Tax=Actinoplanes TaxID=1865 RepID=UPI000697DD78|nr:MULTISPECIES: DUF1906 domain-containing protein [Actinoplanes]GLY06670.1 hypothetical protein Acsp01_70490 [Actinoplanes sp. NBRC 101535]
MTFANAPARAAAPVPPQPGDFRGYGFDACTAPSGAAMKAWLRSSYRAVGIYFGGNNRGCAQPHLTPSWVREQVERGWRMIPLYVGPQASCSQVNKRHRIDNRRAAAMGRAAAEDAAWQAGRLGLPPQSVLFYDMEAYQTGNAACRNGVLAFVHGWTGRLHLLGYLSGFYSSASSGVTDQVAAYHRSGYDRPDFVNFARWDGAATVHDKVIPVGHWSPQRRMKQYRGPHRETWNGVTLNIDSNYLDVARVIPVPPTMTPPSAG